MEIQAWIFREIFDVGGLVRMAHHTRLTISRNKPQVQNKQPAGSRTLSPLSMITTISKDRAADIKQCFKIIDIRQGGRPITIPANSTKPSLFR